MGVMGTSLAAVDSGPHAATVDTRSLDRTGASHNSRGPRELSIVRDISQTLAERPDLKAALRQALQTLATQSAVGIQGAIVVVPGERAGQGDLTVAEGTAAPRPRNGPGTAGVNIIDQVPRKGVRS